MDFTVWTAIQITILWSTSTVSGRSLHRSWTRVNIWKTALTIGGIVAICSARNARLLYDRKGGFYFQVYTIDAESLRQLGGSYLLSAAYIDHSEDTGLELMRPEALRQRTAISAFISIG